MKSSPGSNSPQPDRDAGEHLGAETRNAIEYARETADYESFPGLLEGLRYFQSHVPLAAPILDAGCGGGRDAVELARTGHFVVALDLDVALLRSWPDTSVATAVRVAGDLTRPPIRPQSLAGIWACASLVHQPLAALHQILEVLVDLLIPGGLLAATMRDSPPVEGSLWGRIYGPREPTLVPPEDFAILLSGAGLAEVSTRPSGSGWYAAWGIKAFLDDMSRGLQDSSTISGLDKSRSM